MSQKFIKLLASDKSLPEKIKLAKSLVEVVRQFGYSDNGRYTKLLREFCELNNIDISHFSGNGKPKVTVVKQTCPQCGKEFEKLSSSSSVTCSHACANIFFAHKQGAKNRKEGISAYRSDLDKFYKARGWDIKCLCCEESSVLDVHHIDEDRANNNINNLVYLCPTHHAYLHRLNDQFVVASIDKYISTQELAVIGGVE